MTVISQWTTSARCRTCSRWKRFVWDRPARQRELIPWFTQEVLRVHPVAVEISRVATEDNVLPLTKPIVGVSGKVYTELPVPAGTLTFISLAGYNSYVRPLVLDPHEKHQGWERFRRFTGAKTFGDQTPTNSDQNDGLM